MIFLVFFLFQASAQEKPTNALVQKMKAQEKSLCTEYVQNSPPVKEQGTSGTCYSQATSRIFDALYKKENPQTDIQSSGLFSAIEYSSQDRNIFEKWWHQFTNFDNNPSYGGGYPCTIFNKYYAKKSVCLKPEEEEAFVDGSLIEDLTSVYALFQVSPYLNNHTEVQFNSKTRSKLIQKGMDKPGYFSLTPEGLKIDGKNAKDFLPEYLTTALSCAKNKNLSDLKDVLAKALEAKDVDSYLSEVSQAYCQNRVRLKSNYECTSSVTNTETQTLAALSKNFKNLETRDIPIGITYCSGILRDGKKFDKKYDCGGHASVITGMRWNEKAQTCEVQITDSTKTQKYSADFESKDGQIWLDIYSLQKSLLKLNIVAKEI